MSDKEKIMIIVWRWRHFKHQDKVVNTALLRQAEFTAASTHPNNYNGKLFDEFAVCKQQPDGTSPLVSPAAKVVRTCVENEIEDLQCSTFTYVENLIKCYKKKNNEVFVFLHRSDGFGEQEVEHIKTSGLADRCFLIGEGRDAIYYRKEYYQGLLGQNGRFHRNPPTPAGPSISIAKEKEKTIDLRYFIKVWNHYKHEFHSKIFELKEDLLTHFYAIYPDQVAWSLIDLREKLEENKTLRLRIASFIENDKIRLRPDEVEQLKLGEIEDKRSYAFDDLKANLKTHRAVDEEYSNVSELLYSYFFEDLKASQSAITVNHLLKEIEQTFAQLLSKL